MGHIISSLRSFLEKENLATNHQNHFKKICNQMIIVLEVLFFLKYKYALRTTKLWTDILCILNFFKP